MKVCLLIKMWCVLVLCPVLLAAGAQTLSIDSQLGTSVEDCFERISIGEQIPVNAIYRNVSELTTRECEQICKQDKQCQAYDYGVGAKGNATCDLSKSGEKELKEKNVLNRHPDYDVYVRRFQCEQSPPLPLKPLQDEGEGPSHRPVFRPEVEEAKRPLADDFDSRPFETTRPERPYSPYRPYKPSYLNNIDRPDDYTNQRPELDRPPSYGLHRPHDIPYRPERPQQNHSDPYDVLHFQGERPQYPGNWRPDPHYPPRPSDEITDIYKPNRPRPDLPPFRPEKPEYIYITRPNRKPVRPLDEPGYGNQPLKPLNYPSSPGPYGTGPYDDPRPPYKPNRPMDYPYRPHDRPSYDYNSQYASNYGQNNDNSIYVEIYNPPRPYKPSQPLNDRPYGPSKPINDSPYGSNYGQNYGYGSQISSGGYGDYSSYNQQSSQSHYGSGIITPLDNYNYPVDSYKPQHFPSLGYGQQDSGRPEKPYNKPSTGHGAQDERPSSGYGAQDLNHRPEKPYERPSSGYGDRPISGYAEITSSSYGDLDSVNRPNKPYNRPSPVYGVSDISQTPEKPYHRPTSGYGTKPQDTIDYQPQKPSYAAESSGYGSSQSSSHLDQSYGSQSSSYGSSADQKPQDGYQKPSYSEKPSYDSNKPQYSSNQGSYGSQGYGSSQSGYNTNQGYGTQSYESINRPSQSSYQEHNQQSSYGGSSQSYGSYQNDYRPITDQKPLYDKPSYSRPEYEYDAPSYGNNPPNDAPYRPYNKPSNNQPYGQLPIDPRPSYNTPPNAYGNRPYDIKPGYNDRPSYEKPGYQTNDKPGYDDKPLYDRPVKKPVGPSYDNDRPDGSYGADSNSEGYKNSGKPKPNQTDGYNANKPDIKPVYEFELDKPNNVPSYIVRPGGEVITSRPVTIGDYGERPERPGYGREPAVSYKACFRRVLAGKRALRSFVRKVVGCERLEDCRRECAEQRRFHCESFNYRLDPSFHGKGLCEMMTQPIEAFDLRRDFVEDKDYDFYELDRNSLEPHCPETLRGPGMLHSGFLSSKNSMGNYQNSWDRNDWADRGHDRDYNRYNTDRGVNRNYGGGRRRYEDQFFVPYQIGLARTNDDQESWSQYGGNAYYKNRNDYHKSISHWGLNDLEPPVYGVRPLVNQNFNYHDLGKKVDRYGYGAWKRGRWNSSGASWNGLDYGESTYFKPSKPVFYESAEQESHERSDEVVIKDCTSRRKPGMSLGSGAIRRSLLARTVVQCEAACFNEHEFKCVSYSYRYSNSHGSDNCFLSERPYRGLELSTDSGSDVYAMPEDHGCSGVSTKPLIESECFWHVRSGAAVDGAAVRAALTAAGLGACEAECIRAQAFFCRGFSFRFDSPTIGDDLENCVLTSTPPTSLESGRGLRPNAGHELYARGNYGRGCEPALYDHVHVGESGECYLQYDNAAKLIGGAIKGQAKVRDERACGQACTDAPFRCLSFSYNNNSPPDTDNCLLSEIRLFDLQRGVDYEHSTDDWLFAFDLFNSQCWRKVHGSAHDDPTSELPRPLSLPPISYSASAPSGPGSGPSGPTGYLPAPPAAPEPYLPSGPPSGPAYKPYSEPRPAFKPSYSPGYPGPGYIPAEPPGYLPRPSSPDYSGPSGPYRPSGPPSGPRPSGPGFLPTGGATAPGYGPSGPFRPSGPPSPPGSGYRPGYETPPGIRPPNPPQPPSGPGYGPGRPGYPDTGYGPPLPPGPPGPSGYPGVARPGDREEEPIAVSWRHYTVSGFPCRKGSSCAQNQIAGHWACEPEGGEIGSWDYCCAPTHRCGYSEGFHKPWCYVGPSQDQWRPCSEKYYPYHQHNIPHPSQGNGGDGPRPPLGRPVPRPHDGPELSYLPEADRRYWNDLYMNGPQAYYDKYGNPLPGYTRVPTVARPYIKYHTPERGAGAWLPAPPPELDPPVPGGLGVPRYWPVAYLHKSPPPNTTYFKYNQTESPISSTTERYDPRPQPPSRNLHRDNDFRDSFSRDPNPREPIPRQQTPREPFSSTQRPREPFYWEQLPREPNPRDPNPRESHPREPSSEPNPREPSSRDPPRDRTAKLPSRPNSFSKVNPDRPTNNNIDNKNHRDEKTRNITSTDDDIFNLDSNKTTTTTPKVEVTETPINNTNATDIETIKPEEEKSEEKFENLKGIDDKIDDFSHSIEVLDIEDAKKGEKIADLKTLEAEERQIEAIGRLLAARRGGKLIIEKRSQKDLESKNIALDKDLIDFNFGNKFPTGTGERRGIVQRVTKHEIEKDRYADKSLEVSETTFVRPPRVLSTTDNIRKAIVNGKVFYNASVREQRDLIANSTRRAKSLRPLEERAPSVIANTNYGKKKVIRTRNVNPVRKVRRVYRRKYNPDEVRRRLLERERSMKENAENKKA